jgi:hypothetical protein
MKIYKSLFRFFLTYLFAVCLLAPLATLNAQRRSNTVAANKPPTSSKCSGATWKMKIENTSDHAAEIYLVVWHDAAK